MTVRHRRATTAAADSRTWPKLQTNVRPHVRERFLKAAEAMDMSLAQYLEHLSDELPELRDAAPAPKDPEHT
jgi:hypothetical protein